MKKFLAILILILTFQTPSWADDIRDFQIEGIALYESVLDHFTKKELEREITPGRTETFHLVQFYLHPSLEIYDGIVVRFKKNENYKIYAINGSIYFKDNINDCFEKKDEIVKELKKVFKKLKTKKGTKAHRADPSGKSKFYSFEFEFNDGGKIQVSCNDWSKTMEQERRVWDQLKVVIISKEYRKYLTTEAYK